mmetsp:Transcript_4860/g.7328  ORF Transcript_4860/g.7328 Transcript_4860/m.7328 type:complete len:527 (-) Transcript_4860:876-2456(-)|eukprot:CAMPEP_0201563274 /NCGR_PEP_ID=MMETSP0173_2-20130828/79793_1 /ASSEMBLY_ACC=CAM_ASM_000268 /TAXON_ID=218659 /ORGANISM="Vexillifera sp., Strain DIVA3 564/2" /LENGTH=526 /DNA_ID=CAMNT_0047977937 /DNA_START=24 /DNA_END=1604 /DNA_ORIENTATION=+
MSVGLGVVIVGCIFAFFLSFSIGANDVANVIGPAIGSKAMSLKQGVIMAIFMEFAGAFLLGGRVADTIRSKILNLDKFITEPYTVMLGMMCATIAAMAWLLIATFLGLPVSATQSTIGAVIGWGLVAAGVNGIKWIEIGFIAASWIISPLLAGAVSAILFWLLRTFILRRRASYELSLLVQPVFYALVVGINLFFILWEGVESIGFEAPPLWLSVTIAVAAGFVCLPLAWFFIVPMTRRWVDIQNGKVVGASKLSFYQKYVKGAFCNASTRRLPIHQCAQLCRCHEDDPEPDENDALITNNPGSASFDVYYQEKIESSDDSDENSVLVGEQNNSPQEVDKWLEEPDIERYDNVEMFEKKTEHSYASLQILVAAFASFAHGANDVSNAIAPFASVWTIYQTGSLISEPVPAWVLVLGGFGICVGLVCLGTYIIKTIGTKLAKITPSRGFDIQFGSAFTVSLASAVGIPISSTQAQVGAVVAVGAVEGRNAVNLKLFAGIAASWVITLPVTGLISAAIFAALQALSGW